MHHLRVLSIALLFIARRTPPLEPGRGPRIDVRGFILSS
jgi:hypothetical protein